MKNSVIIVGLHLFLKIPGRSFVQKDADKTAGQRSNIIIRYMETRLTPGL